MSIRIKYLSSIFALGFTLSSTACQSDKSIEKNSGVAPITAEDARHYNGIDLLTSADQEYQEYHRNLTKLHLHFSTTLHAVNRSLFIKPQCVSQWFEQVSKIDQELSALKIHEERMFKSLRVQHQFFSEQKQLEYKQLEEVRTDLSYNDSRMQLLLPQMSQLLAHALQQHQGC